MESSSLSLSEVSTKAGVTSCHFLVTFSFGGGDKCGKAQALLREKERDSSIILLSLARIAVAISREVEKFIFRTTSSLDFFPGVVF